MDSSGQGMRWGDDLLDWLCDGGIAQLGERVVRNDKAVGSIPSTSTTVLPSLEPARFAHQTGRKH